MVVVDLSAVMSRWMVAGVSTMVAVMHVRVRLAAACRIGLLAVTAFASSPVSAERYYARQAVLQVAKSAQTPAPAPSTPAATGTFTCAGPGRNVGMNVKGSQGVYAEDGLPTEAAAFAMCSSRVTTKGAAGCGWNPDTKRAYFYAGDTVTTNSNYSSEVKTICTRN